MLSQGLYYLKRKGYDRFFVSMVGFTLAHGAGSLTEVVCFLVMSFKVFDVLGQLFKELPACFTNDEDC